ncbi:hypothetical protein BG006_004329, partial [Podila minutissima]
RNSQLAKEEHKAQELKTKEINTMRHYHAIAHSKNVHKNHAKYIENNHLYEAQVEENQRLDHELEKIQGQLAKEEHKAQELKTKEINTMRHYHAITCSENAHKNHAKYIENNCLYEAQVEENQGLDHELEKIQGQLAKEEHKAQELKTKEINTMRHYHAITHSKNAHKNHAKLVQKECYEHLAMKAKDVGRLRAEKECFRHEEREHMEAQEKEYLKKQQNECLQQWDMDCCKQMENNHAKHVEKLQKQKAGKQQLQDEKTEKDVCDVLDKLDQEEKEKEKEMGQQSKTTSKGTKDGQTTQL